MASGSRVLQRREASGDRDVRIVVLRGVLLRVRLRLAVASAVAGIPRHDGIRCIYLYIPGRGDVYVDIRRDADVTVPVEGDESRLFA